MVAAVPPMVTAVAPVKPVPVIVMAAPPAKEPLVGEILVTVGTAIKVNKVLAALVPPGVVVTSTLAVPAVPAGVVAVILVELPTITLVAGTPLMVTAVAPVKLIPVMAMVVPPATGPLVGEILVRIGTGMPLNS